MGDLDVKGQVLETGLKVLQNKARIDYCTMQDEKRGENSADGEERGGEGLEDPTGLGQSLCATITEY